MSIDVTAIKREYKLYRNRWRRRKVKVLALCANKGLTKYWGYSVIERLAARALEVCDDRIDYYENKLKQINTRYESKN